MLCAKAIDAEGGRSYRALDNSAVAAIAERIRWR
jgi:hypothetical protein